jgi:hypothetical protein
MPVGRERNPDGQGAAGLQAARTVAAEWRAGRRGIWRRPGAAPHPRTVARRASKRVVRPRHRRARDLEPTSAAAGPRAAGAGPLTRETTASVPTVRSTSATAATVVS